MKIIIGFDDSSDAWHALELTKRLCRNGQPLADSTKIIIYHGCGTAPAPVADVHFTKVTHDQYEELRASLAEHAQDMLRQAADELSDLNVPVTCMFDWVAPAQGMAELAEREGAELIIVGTRGLTGLKRLALGSVSRTVLELAPCSVVVARAPLS